MKCRRTPLTWTNAPPLYSPGTSEGHAEFATTVAAAPNGLRHHRNGRCPHDEENVSAEHAPPEAQARFPRSHEDTGREGDPEGAPREGPRAPVRLTPDKSMPSMEALSGRPRFRRVYASGRRCSRDGVTVIASPREDGPARLGLSVGRSAGKAVVRNRIRRRLRAAVRGYGPAAADIVVVGREAVASAPFGLVEESVRECLARTGVARA